MAPYSEATINNNDPVNEKYLTKIITYFLSQRIYRFIILFKKNWTKRPFGDFSLVGKRAEFAFR